MPDSSAIDHGAEQAAAHTGQAHDEHPAYLRHHFNSTEQQADTTNFAMWLFLVTEVMFFGGLFTAYLIYRNWYYPAFVAGSHQLNVIWGTLEHAGADLLQLYHGHGRMVRGDGAQARAGCYA